MEEIKVGFRLDDDGCNDDGVTRWIAESLKIVFKFISTRTSKSHEKMEAFVTIRMIYDYVTYDVDMKLAKRKDVDDFGWK